MAEIPPSPAPAPLRLRVPIHLEEAPAFHLGAGHGRGRLIEYVWQQQDTRRWRILGDSRHGIGGDLAQRLWLAFLALYDDQGRPEDGTVRFSFRRLCELLGLTYTGGNRERLAEAIVQLDATRMYVTGTPLPGPTLVPLGAGAGRPTYLYRFLGDGGMTLTEEMPDGQQYLFPPASVSRDRLHSNRRLSTYVVESLRGHSGRLVPEFLLALRGAPYAVRVCRLIGKRANGDAVLRIRLSSLAPALPAVSAQGELAPLKDVRRALHRAHEILCRQGFLSDVHLSGEGLLSYHFAPAYVASTPPAQTSEWAEDVVAMAISATGRPDNEAYYRRCVRELGPDQVNGLLRELVQDPGSALSQRAARLGARLEDARRRRHDEAMHVK